MLKTIDEKIDGLSFQIIQFPARQGLKLEKRTITLFLPILNSLSGLKEKEENIESQLDKQINFDSLISAGKEILSNLDDDIFEDYIFAMLSKTMVVIKENAQPQQLINRNIFDMTFAGKSMTLFKLIFKIMKANNFCFFDMLGGGGLKINT